MTCSDKRGPKLTFEVFDILLPKEKAENFLFGGVYFKSICHKLKKLWAIEVDDPNRPK